MENKKDLESIVKEIDEIHQESVKRLNELHYKKMDLIKEYLKQVDSDRLAEIRKILK
jgi:hypothetical protein